jgi:EAL domain-containing protein (putative c-di-GMP-specific phosphodiesterase class I)
MLLRRGDMAMQAAKRDEARCLVFSAACDPYSPQQLATLGELRRALEADQLLLHYQPKVDLRSRHVVGTEALVRWQHPKRGLVPPDQFISLAERGGLIKSLTRWVLAEAVGQCNAWRRAGTHLPVSVNLSARNLQDPQLADHISELLDAQDLGPESLELEITENAMMADPPRAAEILRTLDKRGVALSIDDFGTGYSSLVYLRKLPVSEIKIDTSFVIGMAAHHDDDTAIVRSTSDLGHSLGLRVVAEGVEDGHTLELLDSFGCDAAQGFHMAHPMPPAQLAVWLKESPWGVRAH